MLFFKKEFFSLFKVYKNIKYEKYTNEFILHEFRKKNYYECFIEKYVLLDYIFVEVSSSIVFLHVRKEAFTNTHNELSEKFCS